MKKLIVSLISAASVAAFAGNANAVEVSMSHTVKNKYVAPAGGNYYDGPIVQSDAYASFKGGLYMELFNTTGIDRGNKSPYGNENDVTIGVAKEFGGLGFDAKASYWDCSHLFSTYPADVVVGTLSVTKKLSESTKVVASYDHYKSTNERVFDGGMCATLKGVYSHRVLAVDFDAWGAIMREDGAFHATPGWVASFSTDVVWPIGDRISVKPVSITVIKPLSAVHDGRKTEWIFGFGVSYSFGL